MTQIIQNLGQNRHHMQLPFINNFPLYLSFGFQILFTVDAHPYTLS